MKRLGLVFVLAFGLLAVDVMAEEIEVWGVGRIVLGEHDGLEIHEVEIGTMSKQIIFLQKATGFEGVTWIAAAMLEEDTDLPRYFREEGFFLPSDYTTKHMSFKLLVHYEEAYPGISFLSFVAMKAGYAVLIGGKSWQNGEDGSWFVPSFVEMLVKGFEWLPAEISGQ